MRHIEGLGDIPENIVVAASVDQMAVLKKADVFLSHCGMNSVNESLYFEVPLVMFPQTNEQTGVARRVEQVGAGVFLKENRNDAIRSALERVLDQACYKEAAKKISDGFKKCGGAKAAAEAILKVV
ncbi:glycosyltransferase [[Clostridium] polysaccharolyticum]|uniref:Glycosyltransferase, MGT family n=1 Tax=[Clostridium] polysaccharolyticum TaxID=29364 RepID=A0A1H9ZAH0_9FIRM|nr:nucleotide disphospho-sugar-binding domain-containing protein [[Clostridium] polysaccharolyticum]SES78472.1 glycosyltransferase, MGT family [[Clostridium] polysaccharolyticum]